MAETKRIYRYWCFGCLAGFLSDFSKFFSRQKGGGVFPFLWFHHRLSLHKPFRLVGEEVSQVLYEPAEGVVGRASRAQAGGLVICEAPIPSMLHEST